MTLSQVRAAARRFAARNGLRPPVDVEAALRAVRAVLVPGDVARAMLSDGARGVSGFVVDLYAREEFAVILHWLVRVRGVRGDVRYLVWVNPEEHPLRRRFTVLHEVAHIVLHAKRLAAGMLHEPNFDGKKRPRVEREADVFAAEVLAPAPEVKRLWTETLLKGLHPEFALGALSRHFLISEKALRIQLEQIGLVG